MPYLMQRSQGRLSSQRLHAVAQFVHCIPVSKHGTTHNISLTAILTCLRFGFIVGAGGACDTGNPNKMTQAWSRRQHRCHTWWVGRVVDHATRRVRVDERGTLWYWHATIRAVGLRVGAVGRRVRKEVRLIRSWGCWRRREGPPGEMRVGVRNHRRRIWLILGRRRLRLFRGHR